MIPRFHAIVRREDGTDDPAWTLIRFLTPDERASLMPEPPQIEATPVDRKKLASTPLTAANPRAYHPTLPLPQTKDAPEKESPAGTGDPRTPAKMCRPQHLTTKIPRRWKRKPTSMRAKAARRFVIQDRDREIFRFLGEHETATFAQVRQKFWAASSPTRPPMTGSTNYERRATSCATPIPRQLAGAPRPAIASPARRCVS